MQVICLINPGDWYYDQYKVGERYKYKMDPKYHQHLDIYCVYFDENSFHRFSIDRFNRYFKDIVKFRNDKIDEILN